MIQRGINVELYIYQWFLFTIMKFKEQEIKEKKNAYHQFKQLEQTNQN